MSRQARSKVFRIPGIGQLEHFDLLEGGRVLGICGLVLEPDQPSGHDHLIAESEAIARAMRADSGWIQTNLKAPSKLMAEKELTSDSLADGIALRKNVRRRVVLTFTEFGKSSETEVEDGETQSTRRHVQEDRKLPVNQIEESQRLTLQSCNCLGSDLKLLQVAASRHVWPSRCYQEG